MALLTITTASLFFFLSFFLWCRKLYHTNYYLLFRLAYSLLVSQQVKVKAVATKPKRTECSGSVSLWPFFYFPKACVGISLPLSRLLLYEYSTLSVFFLFHFGFRTKTFFCVMFVMFLYQNRKFRAKNRR